MSDYTPVTGLRTDVEVRMDEFEQQLLTAARNGEASAGPLLVSHFGVRLLGYAHAHAPGLSDAAREQIVEMAVEAGTRALDQFDPQRGSLFGWFRRQVQYKTADWYRHNPPTAELNPDYQVDVPQENPPSIEVRNALREALSSLEEADQIVILLRTVERLAFAEIALRLGISNDSARQRHVRALRRLRASAAKDPALAMYSGEEVRKGGE